MLNRRLEEWLPSGARYITQQLAQAGFHSWIVGGCVRDSILAELNGTDKQPEDWDLATNALPEEVMRLFRHSIPTGIDHGTVTVMLDGCAYELTTLRAKATYTDGRRPDRVHFVDEIEADLARRDFTVNAIAYDVVRQTLIDPFAGVDDLKQGLLVAVGAAQERFAEDGLRVLRGARFCATLEFSFESRTAAAIESSLDGSYRKVSAERIREEWLKAMKARKPSLAFEVMRQHGMLAITAPELLEAVGCEQNRYHAFDVWGHTMACMDACPASPVLRMAGLLHDVGKPRSREYSEKTKDFTFYNHEAIGADLAAPLLARLKFSNQERSHIVGLVRHHLICYDGSWSDSAVRRWLRRVSPELAEDLYLLGRADAVGKGKDAERDVANIDELKGRVAKLVAEGAALSVRDLALRGGDLISNLGLMAGPQLGKILRTLLDEVTDDPLLNTKERLLVRAKELAASSNKGS